MVLLLLEYCLLNVASVVELCQLFNESHVYAFIFAVVIVNLWILQTWKLIFNQSLCNILSIAQHNEHSLSISCWLLTFNIVCQQKKYININQLLVHCILFKWSLFCAQMKNTHWNHIEFERRLKLKKWAIGVQTKLSTNVAQYKMWLAICIPYFHNSEFIYSCTVK